MSYISIIGVFIFGSFLNFFDVNATSMHCKYRTHNCNTIIFKLGLAPSSIISLVSPKSIKLKHSQDNSFLAFSSCDPVAISWSIFAGSS